MYNDKYTTIEQFIEEVESLGDFRDPSQKDNYLKVISNIVAIYDGYKLADGKKGYYPPEVFEAIIDICKKKFPSREELFEENGDLREGMPDNRFCNYLWAATYKQGIRWLGERVKIMPTTDDDRKDMLEWMTEEQIEDYISSLQQGTYIIKTELMTEEEAKVFISSAREYLTEQEKKKVLSNQETMALQNKALEELKDMAHNNKGEQQH